MNNQLLIKICGISQPQIAAVAATAGANFIGIVFHPQSSRYVNIQQAIAIAKATVTAGAIPVAVFVNQNANEMHNICLQTTIHTVQLHGDLSRSQHYLLPKNYTRIYVQNLLDNGHIINNIGLQYLDPGRDFILIDNTEAGSGNIINYQQIDYNLPFRWLIAGGLSAKNVNDVINYLQPHGVDVSSGVELSKGNKDCVLIQQFIQALRGNYE